MSDERLETIVVEGQPNEAPITELYAIFSVDDSGNEGICGLDGTPLVFGYERVAMKMWPLVEQIIAANPELTLKLVKFTNQEVIKIGGGQTGVTQ